MFLAPFRSHVALHLRLAAALGRAGHEVIVLGPEVALGPARDAGLSAVLDPRCSAVGERLAELRRDPGHPTAALATQAVVAEVSAELFAPLTEQLLQLAPALVIGDALAPWAGLAAHWLGLPSAVSVVAHSLTASPAAPGSGTAVARDRELEARLGRARRFLGALGAGSAPPAPLVLFTSPRLSAGLFAGRTTHHVGPLGGAADGARSPSADGEPPLVYVSLGTVAGRRPELLRAILAGLAAQPVRVRLVTWKWLDRAALGPLPANSEVVEQTDQPAELARAAAFVTHAGVNSVLESLLAGVPMLCAPGAGDQFAGADRVTALGAGLTLGAETPGAIAAGVARLLDEPRFRARARDLGDELRAIDGDAAVGDLVAAMLSG
jgi:zeaxanthin glucosyltransferase